MTSLRPLDPSFAVSASARPRHGLVPPGALRRRGAVAALGRHHAFSCRAGSAASAAERTKEKSRMDSSKQDTIQLLVCLNHQVKFGEHVGIIGSTKELGKWKNQVEMEWTPNGWVCQLEIPGEQLLEFKFVIFLKGGKEKIWEDGDNLILDLPKVGTFDIVCHWNRTDEPLDLSGATKVKLAGKPEKDIGEDAIASEKIASEVIDDISGATDGYPTSETDSSKFGELWQGSTTVFMRSNEHQNKDSNGKQRNETVRERGSIALYSRVRD